MKAEMKTIEREYITILGIFAAIMLAFVGSYTFSTSVLNNIGKVSLSSLLIISSLIGIVFYKLISLLLSFLYDINGKERPSSINMSLKIQYLLFFVIGLFVGIFIYHHDIPSCRISSEQSFTFFLMIIDFITIEIYLTQ